MVLLGITGENSTGNWEGLGIMALEGTLHDMSLSDLFQIFRLGPKSGVLVVSKQDERGVIYVDRGRLLDAFVVRGSERTVVVTADEAVLYTLSWDEASFVFRHDLSVTGRAARIQHDAEWLVLESMRRRSDPLRALPYHRITLDTQLQLSPLPTNAESTVSLDVDQWRILSHAANNQDLRTICKATGIEPERALHIVAALISIGLVEIVAQPLPIPPQRLPTAASSSSRSASSLLMEVAEPSQQQKVDLTDKNVRGVGRNLLGAIMRRISEL